MSVKFDVINDIDILHDLDREEYDVQDIGLWDRIIGYTGQAIKLDNGQWIPKLVVKKDMDENIYIARWFIAKNGGFDDPVF